MAAGVVERLQGPDWRVDTAVHDVVERVQAAGAGRGGVEHARRRARALRRRLALVHEVTHVQRA